MRPCTSAEILAPPAGFLLRRASQPGTTTLTGGQTPPKLACRRHVMTDTYLQTLIEELERQLSLLTSLEA
jgi:hypothetical protein